MKTSKLLDRKTPEGIKSILQIGTSAVMAIKQEAQCLIMLAQAVVQNQLEVSVVVQGNLEAPVYGGMTLDEN